MGASGAPDEAAPRDTAPIVASSPGTMGRSIPLGIILFVTMLVAFALLGSVREPARIVVHLLVAIAALAARAMPDAALRHGGATLRWIKGTVIVVGVALLACVPVPTSVARIVAPGRLAALPDAGFMSLGTDVEGTVGAAFALALALGFGAVVSTWGAARYRRTSVDTAIVGLTGLLAASGLLHAVGGATAAFNVLRPVTVPTPFFAPLVNPAHMAAAMLLGAPVALVRVVDRSASTLQRWAAGIVVGWAVAVVVWVHSEGAILAGSAAAGAVLARALVARQRRESVRAAGGAGAAWLVAGLAPVVGLVVWAGWNAWTSGSVTVRWGLWSDALRLGRDHWLVGSGWGDFGEAIRAYRTDRDHIAFAHAHNEALEWAVGTGVLGAIGLVGAVALVWTRSVRRRRRGGGLLVGVGALLAYTLVDFPLQVPAVAMALAAVLACFVSVYGPIRPAAPGTVRAVLLALAVAQGLGAAWNLRIVLADAAAARVEAGDASGLATLRALGARSEVVELHEALQAADPGPAVEVFAARHPDDADALRRAGAHLARLGKLDAATRTFTRVTVRDPSDQRAYAALARVARARGDLTGAAGHWADALRRNSGRLREAWQTFPVGLYWVDALADAPPHQMWALASLLHREGAHDEALLAVEAAAEMDPAAYGDHVFRVQVLLALDEPARALAWVEGVASRAGDSPAVLAAWGDVLSAQERHAEAADRYRRAGRGKPELRARAIRSMEAAAGPARALAFAREMELDGVEDPAAGLEVARLHLATGDAGGCVAEIERRKLDVSVLHKPASDLLRLCRRSAP
jgi:tetratricopeptide (TPR) repeat protein